MPEASLHGGEALPGSVGSAIRYPDVSALGRTLALDLSSPWWKALWRGRLTLDNRVDELKRLIATEFTPLVEELVKVASAALAEQAQHATRQARLGTVDIVNSIQRRSAELAAQMQKADSSNSREVLAELDRQWHEGQSALQHWSRLRTGLSNLVGKCDSTFEDPAPPVA